MNDIQHKEQYRCGMVSIVGRPNVGKSTLLNHILGEKIAIVSKVPQTTRNQVRGIYNDERGQIVFIDTPGLHLGKDKLDQFMNSSAYGTMEDADCVIHLVDASEPVGKEEEEITQRLAQINIPIVLGLNKIDFKSWFIPEYISLWEQVTGRSVNELNNFVILPLSGQTGKNVDKLLDLVFEFLPEGPALYPTDTIADVPQKMAIADIVREKLFNIMRQEVPHSLAVIIEEMAPRKKNTLFIRVLIVVETESQKKIVIGKEGQVLKQIGTEARLELEGLLESKIFMDIYVKTRKNWRDDYSLLEQMGYISP